MYHDRPTVIRSREYVSAENDGSVNGIHRTSLRQHSECVIFVREDMIQPAELRLAAQLAAREGSLLIGLMAEMTMPTRRTAENLRLLLRFCGTVVLVDPIRESYSDVAFAISEGLKDNSRRGLRTILTRGQLARAILTNSSSNIDEALHKALRILLPVAEFSCEPQVYLNILGREVDRKTVSRATGWISDTLHPSGTIVRHARTEGDVKASVFLLVTGIAFPHSPSFRQLSIEIDELEPESDTDRAMEIALGLDQME